MAIRLVLGDASVRVFDSNGDPVRGPVVLEMDMSGEPIKLPLHVEDTIGPEAAEMLQWQMARLVAQQMIAASLRQEVR